MADLIRKALIELVDLQDMKVAMAKLAAEPDYMESPPKIVAYDCMATGYANRRSAAWEAARAALAASAAPKCPTCGDRGMIGGPSYSQPDEGGEPCPDCAAPAPQEQPSDAQDALRYRWLRDHAVIEFNARNGEALRWVAAHYSAEPHVLDRNIDIAIKSTGGNNGN